MANVTIRDPFQELIHRTFGEDFLRSRYDADEGLLPLDISQNGDEILVRASLPGFSKEDIDVQIHQGVLTIKAQFKVEEESKNERFYRRERRMGSLSRRVALPGRVNESGTRADLKDGVLTLRLPVSEQAKPKRVQIS